MFIGRRTRIKDVIKRWKCSRLADIDKALKPKSYADPKQKLPQHYHDFLYIFNRKAAETSPPFRGKSVDHTIHIEKNPDTGNEEEVPWGPLYPMTRDEVLVHGKTLTDLLDKGFIRVSNSSETWEAMPRRPNAEKWKNAASLEWEILLRKETLEPIFPHQLDEEFESKKQLHTKTIPLE